MPPEEAPSSPLDAPPKDGDGEERAGFRLPVWAWLGLVALLGLLALGLGGREVYRKGRALYARSLAEQSLEHLDQKNMGQATKLLAEANRLAGEDPTVLRTTTTFLTRTSNDPRSLIILLRKLADTGHALPADVFALARAHLALGEVRVARDLHGSLVADQEQSAEGLELLAQILRAEGRTREAQDTLRRALSSSGSTPGARLRLALLDYENPFPEVQQRARDTLWELAKGRDDTAITALTFLARDRNLGALETERLVDEIGAHPQATTALRFEAVSAMLRVQPHRRAEILDAETARFRDRKTPELLEVVAWLAREQEHNRILTLVPPEISLQSSEIFPYIAQALSHEARWDDLKRLLTTTETLPVPRARVEVWLAQAAAKLDANDRIKPREHLERAVDLAGRSQDLGTFAAASQVAEEQGLYELAIRCWERLIPESPRMEVELLEKIHQNALRLRDTRRLLEVSRRQAELRPASGLFRDRLQYLNLLTGRDVETCWHALSTRDQEAMVEGDVRRLPTAFLQAFCAFRLRDEATLRSSLSQVTPHIADLTPGHRAVMAALWQRVGQPAASLHLAESVNPLLLLPEEQSLLQTSLRR